MQLYQPQEVEVYYILPAIRRELSIALKAVGRPQKEIAELLGVTPAAVSQYLHDKRAHVPFPKEFTSFIAELATGITDTTSMIAATQKILKKIKDEKLICKIHAKHAQVPKNCEVCFT